MRHPASSASAAESMEPGHHSGKLPAAQRLLVLYHYYEDLRSCPADEEVQLLRTNFAYFLRCAGSAVSGWHDLLSCVAAARLSQTAVTLACRSAGLRSGQMMGQNT